MEINLSLTKENVKLFCENMTCSPKEIEKILLSYFNNDVESRFYRDLAFNVDKFLLSKQIGELVILRADAEIKKVKFVDT